MATKSTTKKYEIVKGNTPMLSDAPAKFAFTGIASTSTDNTTRSRRNRGSTIERTDKYANIDAAPLPFTYFSSATSNQISPREAVILCQKAYFNIAIVRNIIDLMTEFSVGNIYFEDGNQSSRDFFSAWMEKTNIFGFQDRFYREYYRSGNPFVWRFEDTVAQPDVKRIITTFGFKTAKALSELPPEGLKIPARYVILNPADILFNGTLALGGGYYFIRLSDYELARLRAPKTDEDLEVLRSLPPAIQKQIAQKTMGVVNIPLDPDKVIAVFYKKQDYEPFGTPMVWPVLEDLNAKLELKKLDMAIARTQQQVILLVTTGAKPDEGGINQENIKELQSLLSNESIGRVLVADFTTQAKFIIPTISDILTPEKYEQLDKDINMGLNNILLGGEKFANQSAKVEVFLARLNSGRDVFMREFLIPEIRRMSKALGFKSYPTPYYEEIKLEDNDVRDRIYVQMAQLGLLTADELITALDSGRLPDFETSIDNQKIYKQNRDNGLFQPLAPAQPDDQGGSGLSQPTGRPAGSPGPQITKHVTPIGGSENLTYSTIKLIENLKAASAVQREVERILRAKFNKKQLSQAQKDAASDIAKIIISNEDVPNWMAKAESYCEKPLDTNQERVNEILDIASVHDTTPYIASLLYVSKKDK
jgi:hypothetical protein